MTTHKTHEYLRQLGLTWSQQGCVVELGCWLGASAVSLLSGLLPTGYNLPYYGFDFWQATAGEVEVARNNGLKLSAAEDLLPRFRHNVVPWYSNLVLAKGDIGRSIENFQSPPIEICLFDAPKIDPLFSRCMEILRPHFLPKVTTVGLLDFGFHRKVPQDLRYLAPVQYVGRNQSSYVLLDEWPDECSCAFFRYEG